MICARIWRRLWDYFQKELQELDRNTVQYMIDEMQEEINQQKEQLAQKEQQLSQKNQQLTQKNQQLTEKNQQLTQKIAELMQKSWKIRNSFYDTGRKGTPDQSPTCALLQCHFLFFAIFFPQFPLSASAAPRPKSCSWIRGFSVQTTAHPPVSAHRSPSAQQAYPHTPTVSISAAVTRFSSGFTPTASIFSASFMKILPFPPRRPGYSQRFLTAPGSLQTASSAPRRKSSGCSWTISDARFLSVRIS